MPSYAPPPLISDVRLNPTLPTAISAVAVVALLA
jgi:hypothetical protein